MTGPQMYGLYLIAQAGAEGLPTGPRKQRLNGRMLRSLRLLGYAAPLAVGVARWVATPAGHEVLAKLPKCHCGAPAETVIGPGNKGPCRQYPNCGFYPIDAEHAVRVLSKGAA